MGTSSGSGPASWVGALLRFAELVHPLAVDWMLVGSAATAVRGVELDPGDLDVLVRGPQDVGRIAAVMPALEDDDGELDPERFLSSKVRPTITFDSGSWTFGRWHLGEVKVEVAHISAPESEPYQLIETMGDLVWLERQIIDLEGTQIPIVPLEVQIATMVARGQDARLARVVDAPPALQVHAELLSRALSARGGLDQSALPSGFCERLAGGQ